MRASGAYCGLCHAAKTRPQQFGEGLVFAVTAGLIAVVFAGIVLLL
ncbi:hypothetical protein [Tranquillimonas rosea]|nr:hypothetical protein [Tranquillimonas rosea]